MTHTLKIDKSMCSEHTSGYSTWRTIVQLCPSNRLINNLFRVAQIIIIAIVLTMIAMSI